MGCGVYQTPRRRKGKGEKKNRGSARIGEGERWQQDTSMAETIYSNEYINNINIIYHSGSRTVILFAKTIFLIIEV